MNQNELSGLLCSPYYFNELSAFDLSMFALGSFVIICILNLYYNKIPRSNSSINELNNPIYQSRDILLQSKGNDINFVFAEKTTSTSVKVILFILIALVVITPIDQLFSMVNSFY